MNYRMISVQSLFCHYAHENGRICKEDAAVTKRLIREELHRRLDAAIASLDEASFFEDGETVYGQFEKGWL